jgi:LacI family transcriptional regulator
MPVQNNKKVTLRSIAQKADVSVSTVSRVLSGQASKYRIRKETEATIRRIAEELNYEPHHLARGLRLQKTLTIGLVIPDISNSFFSSIARSIEIEARKANYSIMLCDSQENTYHETDSLQLLVSRKVDGLIICPVGEEYAHLEKISENGIPLVVVDRYFPDLRCSCVTSDNYQGALEAVEYLIARGHKRIGCIQGLLNSSVNRDRVKGFKDAHKNHHIPLNASFLLGNSFGERNGYLGAKLLLNKTIRPTAIFALSNQISLGAMRAINEDGLKIPEDTSLLSFDDHPYSEFLSTPLTTVTQQNVNMGKVAIKILFDQLSSPSLFEPIHIKLPTKLVERKSVRHL